VLRADLKELSRTALSPSPLSPTSPSPHQVLLFATSDRGKREVKTLGHVEFAEEALRDLLAQVPLSSS
jgi:hypothetical protein